MANSRTGDSVIDRLVRVLATFDAEHTEQSPSDISRRAGLPASTGHRLVGDLVASGLLERDDEGRARAGMRLWELATRGSLALGLRQAALPAMERVQALVRQHTQLGVLDGDQVLFLERLSHPDAGANITRIAGRLPLHASSSGLVLLAFAPPAVAERVLAAARPARARHDRRPRCSAPQARRGAPARARGGSGLDRGRVNRTRGADPRPGRGRRRPRRRAARGEEGVHFLSVLRTAAEMIEGALGRTSVHSLESPRVKRFVAPRAPRIDR